MRRLFLILGLALLPLAAAAQTVSVVDRDGNRAEYAMTPSGGLYFVDESLVVRTAAGVSADTFALANVARLLFDETQGIAVADDGAAPFAVGPNPATATVSLTGLPQGRHTLVVRDLEGRQWLEATVHDGSVLDVSQWPAGVYILSIGEGHRKLIKH